MLISPALCAGEKLGESNAADVRELCSTLLNCYLIQLLETGMLHADPYASICPPLHLPLEPNAHVARIYSFSLGFLDRQSLRSTCLQHPANTVMLNLPKA